jgi:hypothetical protein
VPNSECIDEFNLLIPITGQLDLLLKDRVKIFNGTDSEESLFTDEEFEIFDTKKEQQYDAIYTVRRRTFIDSRLFRRRNPYAHNVGNMKDRLETKMSAAFLSVKKGNFVNKPGLNPLYGRKLVAIYSRADNNIVLRLSQNCYNGLLRPYIDKELEFLRKPLYNDWLE